MTASIHTCSCSCRSQPQLSSLVSETYDADLGGIIRQTVPPPQYPPPPLPPLHPLWLSVTATCVQPNQKYINQKCIKNRDLQAPLADCTQAGTMFNGEYCVHVGALTPLPNMF